MARRGALLERFEAKVDRSGGPDACHLWTASTNTTGYGQIRSGPGAVRMHTAHRVAWELARGPVPSAMHVLHACDNRRCVNVAHLRLGTHAENMRDMATRDRAGQRGERSPQAKLSEADIAAIRTAHEAGELHRETAARFGVSRELIGGIVRGERWRHVA